MTCPECEANAMRAEAAELDTRLTEKALRKERQATAQLKAMLADKHRQAPNAPQVIEIVEHWASELGHVRAKVVTDDKRADLVRKALGWGYTVADLKVAIDGLARYPYVWDTRNGRSKRMRYGVKAQRADGLHIVLADTKAIERFIGYALEELPDERQVMVPARVLDRMHQQVLAAREAASRYRDLAWSERELVRDLCARLDKAEAAAGRWSGQAPLDGGLRLVKGEEAAA